MKKGAAEKEYGMKSAIGWIVVMAIALIVFFVIGYFAGRSAKTTSNPAASSAAPSVSSEESSAVSSEANLKSSSQSQEKSASSQPAKGGKTEDKNIAKIQSAINMDWKKYDLRKVTPSTVIGKKTYATYSMWDQDYQEGPQILVDPDTGKVYTYTTADKAPVPAETDPAFDQTVRSVTGVVKDGAMMSVLIKTSDGKQLSIRRLGVNLINLDNGFTIGSTVKVYYTGVIQGNSMQRAFVTKIEGVSK